MYKFPRETCRKLNVNLKRSVSHECTEKSKFHQKVLCNYQQVKEFMIELKKNRPRIAISETSQESDFVNC